MDESLSRRMGKFLGFFGMYLIFTIILYFLLRVLNKLPVKNGFFIVILITLAIILAGLLLKLTLK